MPRTSSLKVGEGERRPAGAEDDEAEAVEPDISQSSCEEGMEGTGSVEPGAGESRRLAEEAPCREAGVEASRGPGRAASEEALRGLAVTVASAEWGGVGSSSPRRSSSLSSNSTMTMASGWW
jgi:hypothetical protein